MGHWSIAPTMVMGGRGAPGVPAIGHVGLDPRRCRACLGDREPAPPPPPPRPARARRVVPLPSVDVTAPTPHAAWRDRAMPGFADATDEYCDRVQRVGAYAPLAPAAPETSPPLSPPTPAPAARRRSAVSIPRTILMAAWSHARSGATLTFADIVVAAWRLDPTHMSLPGYDFPDSHRVLAKICGRYGLLAQGLLERTGPATYRVTPAGAVEVNRLARLAQNARGA